MDLYAGSGAIGLEALSRGAAHALLVESDPRAARVIRANADSLGLPGARVAVDRAERLTAAPCPDEPYDLVFADPPYAVPDGEVAGVLAALLAGGWLAPDALVAVERETRGGPLPWPPGYEPARARRYGEASVWYGRPAGNQ
jgi:16S rRNA (guanine966-N2)-methyltransferase